MATKKNLPNEHIRDLLHKVYTACEKEDDDVRQRQMRKWRQLKLLWEGYSALWYSEVAHDWRVADWASSSVDQADYDKQVNLFRAYIESIIAALSVTVPPIKCFPDDADNPLDLTTANTGDKIAQLIYRHNNAAMLWLKALFIYTTEGLTAFYNYVDSDESYGTYQENDYKDVEQTNEISECPNCGYELSNEPASPERALAVNTMTDVNANQGQPAPPMTGEPDVCPACGSMITPQMRHEVASITQIVETKDIAKSRICIEVYGGMNIKVPNYATCQYEIPYLIFSRERSYLLVMQEYDHLADNDAIAKLDAKNRIKKVGGYDHYDQWGRTNPQYQGEMPPNVVTESAAWLRPAAYNFLDKDDADDLRDKYPDGVKVVYINDQLAEAKSEKLDEHWTLTENPLSNFLHFEPLGRTLVSVQEITNDMISLVLQTIEHGIGQTFADPAVLDFKSYEQTEVSPGSIFPASPKTGKGLGEGFFQVKTATLSGEVMPFMQQIQSMAQITSGALPSIFGGQIEGSETASEYSMSRAQALQRLQNSWKLFTTTWKTMFSKVVPMYIREVQHDENDVTRGQDGNFVNTLIRRAEMVGKIGKFELEANENLPLTWGQKKDLVMQLLTNPSPKIMEIMMAPENTPLIHEALGLSDFFVPGEDDLEYQNEEIKLLLNSTPMPNPHAEMDKMAGGLGMEELPSIPIDPMIDKHPIHFEGCRKWAISREGQDTKVQNPDGYKNVLLHARMHFEQMNMQMMPPQGEEQNTPPQKPNPLMTKEAPIQGEGDVQTIQ